VFEKKRTPKFRNFGQRYNKYLDYSLFGGVIKNMILI